MLDDIWQMDIQKISRTVDLFHVQGFENFEYHEVEYTIVDDFGRPTGEFETDTYYCWTNIVPSTGIRLFYVIHDDPSRDELTLSIFTEDLWRFRNQLFNEPERPWWDVRYDMFDTY
jgi:hypothetical protein